MKRMRNAFRDLVAVFSAVSLVVGAALPAVAVDVHELAVPPDASPSRAADDACLDALPENADETVGLYTVGVVLGSPQRVDADSIMADSSLSTAQKADLVEESSAAAIRSNHWSQFVTGGAYTQTQNGTFYYDGDRVWVSTGTGGYTGSHDCFTNYVVPPWGVSNMSKSESGSLSSRVVHCSWNVDQAGMFTSSFSMDATLGSDGSISGAGATVG